ncbi:hypothetical protein EJB05_34248, partial [Eragrostis curvula]
FQSGIAGGVLLTGLLAASRSKDWPQPPVFGPPVRVRSIRIVIIITGQVAVRSISSGFAGRATVKVEAVSVAVADFAKRRISFSPVAERCDQDELVCNEKKKK